MPIPETNTSQEVKRDPVKLDTSGPESALASIARVLANPGERISMHEHAALRRMNPQEPGAAAAIVCRMLQDRGIELGDDSQHGPLLRWCVLIHALALARGAHDRSTPIGKALWEMGYSEQRINQLLVADQAGLTQLIPRLARRLQASKVPAMDFIPLMYLLLATSDEGRSRARLTIARSCARFQP